MWILQPIQINWNDWSDGKCFYISFARRSRQRKLRCSHMKIYNRLWVLVQSVRSKCTILSMLVLCSAVRFVYPCIVQLQRRNRQQNIHTHTSETSEWMNERAHLNFLINFHCDRSRLHIEPMLNQYLLYMEYIFSCAHCHGNAEK